MIMEWARSSRPNYKLLVYLISQSCISLSSCHAAASQIHMSVYSYLLLYHTRHSCDSAYFIPPEEGSELVVTVTSSCFSEHKLTEKVQRKKSYRASLSHIPHAILRKVPYVSNPNSLLMFRV
jgi:hypothetical protein